MIDFILVVLVLLLIERALSYQKKHKRAEELILSLKDLITKINHEKKKSEIITGQVAEKMAPFLKGFNHNPQDAQFLGHPIDFIVFEDDKISIIEVKSGNAKLTSKQRQIRDLIKDGKVEWEVYRIK